MNQQSNPLVTIGFCFLNEEKNIMTAIESVIDQDFPHEKIELLFVDDGSTDNSLQVVNDFISKTEFKSKVFSTSRRGLGPARQTVVENATGDYIIFVDADSTLSTSYVSKQIAVMEKYPQVGIASGLFGICPEDNWVATLENINYVITRLNQKCMMTQNLISTAGSTIRVSALRQVGGFCSEIKGSQEDIDVAFRLKRAGWKSYISDAVFYHRFKQTWKGLWRQHFWYGYGLHFLLSKNNSQNAFRDKSVDRIIFSSKAYKLTKRKSVFLLPLNFIFKKAALFFGYVSAYLDGHSYSSKNELKS